MRWTSTRESIQTALAYGCAQLGNSGVVARMLLGCKIDKTRMNNDDFIVDSLECGQICAEINAQPPLIRSWLTWCYGPNDSKHDQAEVAMGVMWQHFPKCGAKMWDRYVELCEIAALDYKCRVIAGKPIPRTVYLTHVHVDDANWVRSGWQQKLEKCLDTLSDYDSKGLARISPIVANMRERSNVC